MQAGGRRVVADIGGDRPLFACGVEALRIGDLVDEAALVEDAQEIGLELGHFVFREIATGIAMASVVAGV